MILNEKIKASEVILTGVNGENLGIVPTSEALVMARELKVDLVCDSLMSSPPPCRLIRKGAAKQNSGKATRPPKLKEIRLTANIEPHDLETKKQQSERILQSGDAVNLVVKLQGKEGVKAKELLESLVKELGHCGRRQTGIQISGKQAAVQMNPL
jgi:translation initiation factor IF-3